MKTHVENLLTMTWDEEAEKQEAFRLWDLIREYVTPVYPGISEKDDLSPPQYHIKAGGHRVMSWLNEYVRETGYVNTHVGLTSSDIEDNVRLYLIRLSLETMHKSAYALADSILRMNLYGPTLGFTHMIPARATSWGHRKRAWTDGIYKLLCDVPTIEAKALAGPVGDGSTLDHLRGPKSLSTNIFEEFGLEPPKYVAFQSSDHICELRALQWMEALAAQIHKIANDVRFLVSQDVIYVDGGSGSSSMPHKSNPIQFEKVCSMARSMAGCSRNAWDVLAHNVMERSLDTSWQMRHVWKDFAPRLGQILDIMLDSVPGICVDAMGEDRLAMLYSELMTKDLIAETMKSEGVNRVEAYNLLV